MKKDRVEGLARASYEVVPAVTNIDAEPTPIPWERLDEITKGIFRNRALAALSYMQECAQADRLQYEREMAENWRKYPSTEGTLIPLPIANADVHGAIAWLKSFREKRE